MKKHIKSKILNSKQSLLVIILGFMTLLLISSALAITQTQLETFSNEDIKNFLIDNAIQIPTYYDKPSNNYIFSYQIKSITKIDNEYQFTNELISAKLDRELWTLCNNYYTFSSCYSALVTSITPKYNPIKYQLRNKLNEKLQKIINWRDNPTLNTNLGGVNLEI